MIEKRKIRRVFFRIIEQKVYRFRRRKRSKQIQKKGTKRLSTQVYSYVRFMGDYLKFFLDQNFINYEYCSEDGVIQSPKFFSFKKDYDGTLLFVRRYLSTYFLGGSHVVLNFSKCEESSIAAFTLLEILIHQTESFKNKYNKCYFHTLFNKSTRFRFSNKDIKTNKFICTLFGVEMPSHMVDGSLFLPLDLIFGRKRQYKNNMKGSACTKVTNFVNEALLKTGFELNIDGKKHIGNLVGEVLSNCEDHCHRHTHWYIDGVAFAEQEEKKEFIQLNFSIINIGRSMFEAFEETKESNYIIYDKVVEKYERHRMKFTSFLSFNKESLYTLYLLNDGISRLKYEDSSRGNGTTRFLNAFITLGGLGNENQKYNSALNIISGHTIITCDNKIKPVEKENLMIVPLNKVEDTDELPDKKYLSYHQEYFPGTILECTIYINSDYLSQIIK